MPVTKFEINSLTPYPGGQSFGDVGAYEQVGGGRITVRNQPK